MKVSDMLAVPKGVTALVGGGGKTTLLHVLGQELAQKGTVLLCTSTKFRMPDVPTLISPLKETLTAAFESTNLLAMGAYAEGNKLGAVPTLMENLPELADYVLVEADGARQMPLKAPADHEPVIPPHTRLVFGVAGMDGIGLPIDGEKVHRPELYADLLGVSTHTVVTPKMAATVLFHQKGQRKQVQCAYAVVLNKADTPERLAFARETAEFLPCPVFICALKSRPEWGELWLDGKRFFMPQEQVLAQEDGL